MLILPNNLDCLLKISKDVHIKDFNKVAEKLKYLDENTVDSLHIVADFDMTLTKYWKDGQRSTSSHGVVEKSNQMSVEAKAELRNLFEKYYPIEISQVF
jgi:hypothetical protein